MSLHYIIKKFDKLGTCCTQHAKNYNGKKEFVEASAIKNKNHLNFST